MTTETNLISKRAPVIAIMGHIDHGKSTLLSYIRKSTTPLREAGGITQHISAYEVEHITPDGTIVPITFLDTPGHEAFAGIRRRGAKVADIAILVVSSEDGVKPQTIEALKAIVESNTPYIVAINKIDKEGANIERTKQSLAENETYVEGWGGNIPSVPISAKSGEGIPELLDMITLVAEFESLTGQLALPAKGVIIESNLDIQKGITASAIIKDGTLSKGMFVATSTSIAPVRNIENYLGQQIESSHFSSPVKIIGFDSLPLVGDTFNSFKTKQEAIEYVTNTKNHHVNKVERNSENITSFLPVIVKADTSGSLEAVLYEISKIKNERIVPQVISCGIGNISENDLKSANGTIKALVVGFNVKIDALARHLADRNLITITTFDIIYKLTEFIESELTKNAPVMEMDEDLGTAKILKLFSKIKDKQIVGGICEIGSISLGSSVRIMRREAEIGLGKIRELQSQKVKTDEVATGKEFGTMIESKIEIAPGDKIICFKTVTK